MRRTRSRPSQLRRLIVDLIDKARPSIDLRDSPPPPRWSTFSADVKGDAYGGLLQKNGEDKGGAGQSLSRFSAGSAKELRFGDALPRCAVTPRPLIAAIMDVVAPQPGQAICDPACGTGGFLLPAHDYLAKHHALDRAQKKKLKSGTFFGIELVDRVTRLCAMNLLLHGIGGESGDGADSDMLVALRDCEEVG